MLTADAFVHFYQPVPAHHFRVEVENRPQPFLIGEVGTGGLASEAYYRARIGYQPFAIEDGTVHELALPYVPWAALMADVKTGFGRTMSRLPEVFGVSRQTLYNWLAGETPKEVHQTRLKELAAAARVFSALGVKPTTAMLDKTVAGGKSTLQLLREGANGAETAQKLVRIEKRASDSRAKLDTLLAGRTARPDVSDMGTPAFREDL